jgi:transcription antitermination factor NusG
MSDTAMTADAVLAIGAAASLRDNPEMMAIARRAQVRANAATASPRIEACAGDAAHWYIITTVPGQQGIAAGHLIGRGFGIYLPEIDRREIVRGRVRNHRVPMFPGYLFLFTWALARNWGRIRACTGVSRILGDGAAGEAAPRIVPDALIDEIVRTEWNEWLRSGLFKPAWSSRKGRKARKQRASAEGVTITTRSYFGAGLAGLDAAGRISLLHRALGLGSRDGAS